MHYLETVDVHTEEAQNGFVMPGAEGVSSQQGFSWVRGQIEVGELSVGDEIRTLPSGETAKVTADF